VITTWNLAGCNGKREETIYKSSIHTHRQTNLHWWRYIPGWLRPCAWSDRIPNHQSNRRAFFSPLQELNYRKHPTQPYKTVFFLKTHLIDLLLIILIGKGWHPKQLVMAGKRSWIGIPANHDRDGIILHKLIMNMQVGDWLETGSDWLMNREWKYDKINQPLMAN